MAFLSKFFNKPKQGRYTMTDILSGITPIYTSGFGSNIYSSDVVQQAIYSIVSELKKLDPVHVRKINGNDFANVGGNIQGVLDAPNPLMTTSDFIEKIAWTLLLNYNAFVYPLWSGNTLVGLYPLQPQQVDFAEDEATGEVWVTFRFANGYVGELPYSNLIHLRYKYSVGEYMGGNKEGQPDFKPLLDTLQLNDTLLKGLAKSLNLQTSINGVVKIRTMQNKEDQLKMVADFEKKLTENKSGLLPLDISAEYTPITKQVALLDNTVLEFIDRKILRTWGVSLPIINGDYTPEQYEAFYQKTLEPIIKSMNQGFTKGIFTRHETRGFNNAIMFYARELLFMNSAQKITLFDMLVDTSSCYKNELRTAFGLRPLAELEGQIAESSNKTNAENNKQDTEGNNDE